MGPDVIQFHVSPYVMVPAWAGSVSSNQAIVALAVVVGVVGVGVVVVPPEVLLSDLPVAMLLLTSSETAFALA